MKSPKWYHDEIKYLDQKLKSVRRQLKEFDKRYKHPDTTPAERYWMKGYEEYFGVQIQRLSTRKNQHEQKLKLIKID
jgi:hypothetical protein